MYDFRRIRKFYIIYCVSGAKLRTPCIIGVNDAYRVASAIVCVQLPDYSAHTLRTIHAVGMVSSRMSSKKRVWVFYEGIKEQKYLVYKYVPYIEYYTYKHTYIHMLSFQFKRTAITDVFYYYRLFIKYMCGEE